MTAQRKAELQGISVNGYRWAYFENGLHYFQKPEGGGWFTICCTEPQILNGDLSFMSRRNLTLSAEKQAEAKKQYLSTVLPLFQYEKTA